MSAGLAAAREADARARRLAQESYAAPLCIEAGAGTGKTAVLVARICVWALGPGWQRHETALRERTGATPTAERIAAAVLRGVVAITFTEAAAAEMAVRVGAALLAIQRGGSVPGIDDDLLPGAVDLREARARALVGTLDQLAVQTIHAFCRGLLTSHALEAGLHPRFQVDASGEGVEAVAREVMERHLRIAYGDEGDPAALALAERGQGPAEVEEVLRALLDEGVAPEALNAPLAPERIRAFARQLARHAGALCARVAPLRAQSAAPKARDTAEALAAIAELAGSVSADRAGLDALLAGVRDRFEPHLGRVRDWSGGKLRSAPERELEDPEGIARAARTALPHLRAAIELEPAQLEDALGLLRPLVEEARAELRRRGVQTFNGLLQDARTLLGDGGTCARVRAGIDQLLVDEFQDTDALQCEIIELLALEPGASDPGRANHLASPRPGLFLVGDPKQSIYGWRNADLRAYEGVVARVRAEGGERGVLCVNHRSVPAVLDEVRRVIAPAMQPEPGLQPAFQPLQPSDEHRSSPGFAHGDWAPVEHWITATVDPASGVLAPELRVAEAVALEARWLARDIARLRARHGVALGEIALLFRTLGDADEYLDALRQAGIPYAVERDRHYHERREIVDARALVRALLDPHDQLALVAALRSSAVGVPDAALVPLWERGLPDAFARLVAGLPDVANEVERCVRSAAQATPVDVPGIERVAGWEESLLAFCRVAGELATARRMLAPDRFVEALRTSLLLEVSEAARSLGAFRSANLDRFFRDLRRALADCEGDVAGVLASLRHAVSDRREQQEGQPRAVEQAVRVMTMHGAKGLQFSHVYLAQLDKRSPAERRSEVSVVRGRGQVALRVFGQATLEYPALAIDRRRVESAERVRTLYVAMTRARERIVLVGRPQARDGTHAALLAARAGGVPGAEEIAACRQGFVDRAGARFVLPGLDPSSASRRRSSPAPETTRADLDHEAARVEARRHAAGRRAARPLSRPASSAGHDPAEGSVAAHELAEESAATRYGADGARTAGDVPASSERPSPAASREEAKAIGIAIHSALEHAELGAAGAGPSPRAARSALERALAQWAGAALSAGARAGANDLLDALIAGPLWRRLGAIAPHVVARELPVLVDPERLAPSDPLRIATGYDAPADDPTGFWSGAIDLLYADPESGEWVVADYKTDAVEGEGLRERARAYARQGAVYTRAVQTALRLPAPPRFELWFLRVGQVVPVPGAEGPTT